MECETIKRIRCLASLILEAESRRGPGRDEDLESLVAKIRAEKIMAICDEIINAKV